MGGSLSKNKHKFGQYEVIDIAKRYKPKEMGSCERIKRREKKVLQYLNWITIDDLLIRILEDFGACYLLNEVALLEDNKKSFEKRKSRAKKYPLIKKQLEEVEKLMDGEDYFVHTVALPNDPCESWYEQRRGIIENAEKNIKKAIRDCKKRFIYINIGIGFCNYQGWHATQLIIDQKNKIMYYFEPFIAQKSSYGLQGALKKYFSKFGKYEFIHSNDLTNINFPAGLQAILPGDQNCVSWSTYYGLLRILNPELPNKVIIDYMGGKNAERAYYMIHNFVYNLYQNYKRSINKFYYEIMGF